MKNIADLLTLSFMITMTMLTILLLAVLTHHWVLEDQIKSLAMEECRICGDLPDDELIEIEEDKAIQSAFDSMALTPDWEAIYSARTINEEETIHVR
jgi:hypothetical protein